MCGIAGFYQADVDDDAATAVLKKLRHRGPDDSGVYRSGRAGLIHTRLSVIELSKLGSQPYRFEQLVLIYNGEMYNYREVRAELEKKSYSFDSNSDSEVIIKAFHCWGASCLDRFIGMFAFVIYDESKQELFAARDRMGVKPFYYAKVAGSFFFASELKAFNDFPFSRSIDLNATYLYFRFGYVPAQYSIFSEIKKLQAGHFMKINGDAVEIKKYWDPRPNPVHGRSEEELVDELQSLVISAFRYRMVSDVPVGVFLSGGMDSSLLAAVLQKHVGDIHSFTIGFDDQRFDESEHAREIAQHLGLAHVEKKLDLTEARSILSEFYTIYDEPFADTSGIPVTSITRLARANGMKVVLSADGGDELFGGYVHYQKALRLFELLQKSPRRFRKLLSDSTKLMVPGSWREQIVPFNVEHRLSALEELLGANSSVHFFESFLANQSNDEISKLVNGCIPFVLSPVPGSGRMEDMMMWDLSYYLPDNLLVKVDRATMHHSLECREPFLDHRLVEFALRLPLDYKIRGPKTKYILRKLLERYFPAGYFERQKKGFSIPIFSWFKKDFDSLFKEYFSEKKLSSIPVLNGKEIMREWKKYQYYSERNQEYNIEKMWRILSFVMWWEAYGR